MKKSKLATGLIFALASFLGQANVLEDWLAREVEGDEGARVKVFANCLTIDSTPECGGSVLYGNFLIVESVPLIVWRSPEKAEIWIRPIIRVRAESNSPYLSPRKIEPYTKTSKHLVTIVRNDRGYRITGSVPYLVSYRAFLGRLEADLQEITSGTTSYKERIILKDMAEINKLRELAPLNK